FNREPHMLIEDASVVAGVILTGERIELAPRGVDDLCDLPCRTGLGPLKHQMFDEVRDAVLAQRLVARSDAKPKSDGNGANMGNRLCPHSNSIAQLAVSVQTSNPRVLAFHGRGDHYCLKDGL